MTPAQQLAQKRAEAELLIRQHAPQRLQDQLIALLRPAIALTATRAEDAQIPIGASKFGGAPDVPQGFEWPMWNDKPLGFLAQVNLEEVAAFDVEELLPKSGLLSFFYEMEEPVWGEADQRDGWRVFFFETEHLQREVTNDSTNNGLGTASIAALPSWTVSTDALFSAESEDLGEEELEQLEAFDDEYHFAGGNQMFGHARVIQNEPGVECEWWAVPKTEARQWILLLQVDSDPAFNGMWGDAGTLYFMIRHEDLIARKFENTWLIMQCS